MTALVLAQIAMQLLPTVTVGVEDLIAFINKVRTAAQQTGEWTDEAEAAFQASLASDAKTTAQLTDDRLEALVQESQDQHEHDLQESLANGVVNAMPATTVTATASAAATVATAAAPAPVVTVEPSLSTSGEAKNDTESDPDGEAKNAS